MSAEAVGWVFRHSPYTGDSLVIHLALADIANDVHGHELWLTRAAIGSKSRCSRSTVDRALATMRADGYLEVLDAGGGRGIATRYRLTKPPQNDAVIEPPFDSPEATRGTPKHLHILGETASFTTETASIRQSAPLVNSKNPIGKTSGPTTFEPPADPAEHRAHVEEIRSRLRHPAGPPAEPAPPSS